MSTMTLPALTGDTSLVAYMERVNKFPYLTQEEEHDLAKDLVERGDVNAAHKLVTSHLRLVVKIAASFRNYGLPLFDLISEGNVGLMQAVKRFDPEKGFRLSTYAMWWIKASIQEYVLHSWSLVKIGTTAAQKKLFFNLRKVKSRLKKVDNRALSPQDVSDIANELDVSEKEVLSMDARLVLSDQSLNTPVTGIDGDDASEMIDLLEETDDNQEILVEQNQELEHKRKLFSDAMMSLNERERDIVTKRRLLDKAVTLDDLSQSYGISRERVRQIENRAMEKLQNAVLEAKVG